MTVPLLIPLLMAASYMAQLGAKWALARTYAKTQRRPDERTSIAQVTIMQAVLSGDPDLPEVLAANLRNVAEGKFIWLLDEDDTEGNIICETLRGQFPEASVTIRHCPPPAQRVNPKVHKLIEGIQLVDTEFFTVLDDDTCLTRRGLRAMLDGLQSGAALSTGLPCYRAVVGKWSKWLAELVNSSAILTYLPSLTFMKAVSINGMCYTMRTETARSLKVFSNIQHALTDDLALALLLQGEGLKIHQTIEPHQTSTSITSMAELAGILHRWFVFARILFASMPPRRKLLVGIAYVVPPLLLWSLVVLAPLSIANLTALLVLILCRSRITLAVERQFLGNHIRHNTVASFIMELVQPVALVSAYARSTIKWRTRRIRVHDFENFEYQ